jgi:hypothetical protein
MYGAVKIHGVVNTHVKHYVGRVETLKWAIEQGYTVHRKRTIGVCARYGAPVEVLEWVCAQVRTHMRTFV